LVGVGQQLLELAGVEQQLLAAGAAVVLAGRIQTTYAAIATANSITPLKAIVFHHLLLDGFSGVLPSEGILQLHPAQHSVFCSLLGVSITLLCPPYCCSQTEPEKARPRRNGHTLIV